MLDFDQLGATVHVQRGSDTHKGHGNETVSINGEGGLIVKGIEMHQKRDPSIIMSCHTQRLQKD